MLAITLKKYSFMLLFLAPMLVTPFMAQAHGRCGCGGRVSTASHGSAHAGGSSVGFAGAHYYGGRHRSQQSSSSSDTSSPDQISYFYGFVSALFAALSFWLWRKWQGKLPQCTHVLAEHVLTWPERIALLAIAYGCLLLWPRSMTAFVVCTISIIVICVLDHLSADEES